MWTTSDDVTDVRWPFQRPSAAEEELKESNEYPYRQECVYEEKCIEAHECSIDQQLHGQRKMTNLWRKMNAIA